MSFAFQHYRPRFAGQAVIAGLVLLISTAVSLAPAQESYSPEYALKAAFLFHFGQFVEWPDKTFANIHAPLVIGLYGPDPFHGDLERIVANQSINGHPVLVRHARTLSEVKTCEVVFIAPKERKGPAAILAAVKGFPVLTVTEDMEHFLKSGFMINLFVANDKIRFEVNNTAAEQAGLKISPKLLNLAWPAQP